MKKHKVISVLMIAAMLCGCILLTACDRFQRGGQVSRTELMLDTYCTITICGKGEGDAAKALLDEAFEICRKLESRMSATIEGSDIWRINNAQGEAVTVAPETAEVILRGIEFGEFSGGMFDITIGRLSNLWDFSGEPHVPAGSERNEARLTVNYSQVTVNVITALQDADDSSGIEDGDSQAEEIIQSATVQLQNPRAELDLGGIAKGYIADRIAEYFIDEGVDNALIDLGGDIVALGSRSDGNPWRIGVRKPFGGNDEYVGVLNMSGSAVVSSGTYERQFVINGIQFHHILNPFTGSPAESDVVGATIISEDAITGEGLSTIAVLVGSERAAQLFETAEGFIGAILVLESGEIIKLGETG